MSTQFREVGLWRGAVYAVLAWIVLCPAFFARAQSGDADDARDSQVEIGVEGGGGTYGWSGGCTSGTVSYGGMAGTVRYRDASGASVTVVGGGGARTSDNVNWTPTWGVVALGGFRGRYVGFEGGVLLFADGLAGPRVHGLPAFRLRIGRLDNYHFRAGFADQVPVQRGSVWLENAVGGLGPLTIALGVSLLPQLSIVNDSDETASISPYVRIEGKIDDRFFVGGSFYLSVNGGVYPQGFGTFGVRL